MKNAYAKKLQAVMDTRLARQQMIDMQMAKDAALIAAAEVFHMGPGRTPAYSAAFDQAIHDIAAMTVEDTKDMEYTKTKLDQRLRQICGEHFVPWEERYG
ncbi:hypothetical protein B5G43_12585 [Flavonifractor sp. An92]|uniref:hypothetical protein n=1 Tax=Flavonifractor sp. An92 TaxID=1965666 RepID=UPI000B36AE86|nr:hypothetical protein [Flavonifractor sp. An92]OUN05516.1 hypothetical protein B5G43_12585 [Flavonifractor sp. An92]